MAMQSRRTGRSAGIIALAGAMALAAGALAASEQRVDPTSPDARMARPSRAEVDNALEIGGEEIGGRKLASRMTVPVQVNGAGPYRFVVDSGADTSVVGRRISGRLGLPAGTSVVLNGITESRRVDRVLVESLTIGPSTIYGLKLPVLNESDLGADGMIGLDALIEQRLMLDFEKRTISVDDARTPAPRLDGEIVVTARAQRGQLILTSVRAGKTSLEAIIDTGSELTIGNLALREQLVRRHAKSFEKVEVAGVTGAKIELELVRIPELRLGPVTLHNVPVAFADIPPFKVFGINDQPAMLLGTDLMETFRKVSLDFRARKVRFQLRRCDTTRVRVASMPSLAARISSDQSTPAVCAR